MDSPQVEEAWMMYFFFKNRRAALSDIFIRAILYQEETAGMILKNCAETVEVACVRLLSPFSLCFSGLLQAQWILLEGRDVPK